MIEIKNLTKKNQDPDPDHLNPAIYRRKMVIGSVNIVKI